MKGESNLFFGKRKWKKNTKRRFLNIDGYNSKKKFEKFLRIKRNVKEKKKQVEN